MLNRIGPAIVRGKNVRDAAFNTMEEVNDWKTGWILDQMKTRNITQDVLVEKLGTTRQSITGNIRHSKTTSIVFRYAIMYVLQHLWYDTDTNEWVVID